MRTPLLSRILHTILVAITLSASIMLTYGQSDPSREILVYFSQGIEKSSTGVEVNITSEAINNLLTEFTIKKDQITSAFPDFKQEDMVKRTAADKLIRLPNMANIFKVQIPEGVKRKTVIDSLRKIPGVLFAEPNGIAVPQVIPNDQFFSYQYSLQQGGGTGEIQAPEAWDIYKGSSSSIIGIIDWGVDGTHPDLTGKVSGDAPNTVYHGTHVAGIASAKTNNTTGVSGVNWNSQILSKNIEYSDDAGIYQKIVSAVDYSSNVNVLNNSWALTQSQSDLSPRYSTTVRMAFAYAYKQNRVAVCANANYQSSHPNQTYYPAGFGQGIIAVGATDNQDQIANFSQVNNAIDVSAPGVNILSTYRNGNNFYYQGQLDANYQYLSGTSMAAPHVSGIASLLKGAASFLYNDDIENIIQLSADDKGSTGWDSQYGYGRVNAKKALGYLINPYELSQFSVSNGTDYYKGPFHQVVIYGANGLADGVYFVYAHEVRKNVTFNEVDDPHVWGRGAVSIGWSAANPNFAMGYCNVVPGTVTNTSATLYTYVYEVYDASLQWAGWYPTTPGNAFFGYTVDGIPVTHVSGTISNFTTWSGHIIVDNNVTVNNGVTLVVNGGTIISFQNGASLLVNGKLDAQGTSSQPITFTAESGTSPSSWENIILSGSGASGSIIKYANINYGNEVQINNVPNFTISNCSFLDNKIAIHADGSTGSILSNNLSSNSTGHSMWFNNSTITCYYNVVKKTGAGVHRGHGLLFGGGSNGKVWRNDIYNVDWGIGAIWGSSPDFYKQNWSYSEGFRNNRITSCNYGVRIYQNSHPTIGEPVDYYGSSTIMNNSVDVSLSYGYSESIYTDACGVYWNGGNPANAVLQVGTNSHLYTSPYSSTNQWASFPLPKIQSPSSTVSGEVLAKVNPNNNETSLVYDEDPKTETDSLFIGISLRHENKYKEAKNYFISYLLKHPNDQRAYIELYNCADSSTITEIIQYFKALPKEASKEQRLFLSYLYQRAGDIKSAKKVNDDLIKEYPNTPLSVRAGIENIYISLYWEDDLDEAVKVFNNVLNKSSLSTTTEISNAEYAIESYARLHEKTIPDFSSFKKKFYEAVNKPEEYSLLGNYPNPFNPSTTISYNLPTASEVEVTIYDILGNEVKSFVIPTQNAGTQKIIWNGRNSNGVQVSSGIYLYHFKAKSLKENNEVFEKSAKLILMK